MTLKHPFAAQVFFNGALDDATAARYCRNFFADSRSGLDLRDYTASLPRWPVDANGEWTAKPAGLKDLVVGCSDDFVVDDVAVQEMADFMGVAPTIIDGAPHDLMLAPGVAKPACDLVAEWIKATS